MRRDKYPIDEVLPALADALIANRSVVLQAPPGAGKSTVVPLALLQQPWAAGKRIIMLEPRRLATRAVAHRMAQTLLEPVGRTVGYRMRLDTRVSRDTRLEVVTEGVFTRMVQNDAALEGVAAVLFDEFHERSLQADLGLALAIDARKHLSADLKLVVMSATLDGEPVSALLGGAPIVTTIGRTFPVDTRYVGRSAPLLPGASAAFGRHDAAERAVSQVVLCALREEQGDVLVFLPGAREIRRVQSLLEAAGVGPSVRVLPLFGELSGESQDAALAPAAPGERKVVLATNIAETSLTIGGVRIIVDSGLVRRSLFDPSTGMSRLETQRISRASAEQRQGRAGRLGPGVCYRLWSESAQRSLAAYTPAEILEADLAPLALELASWGTREAAELCWLDEPPAAMLASARNLLQHLGALDAQDRITAHGRLMARLSVQPRLAHMLLRAVDLDCLPLAADLAAILSERDLLRAAAGARDADIRSRLDLLRDETDRDIDRGTLQRARRAAGDLHRQVASIRAHPDFSAAAASSAKRDFRPASAAVREKPVDAGLLLALAYPDRIARRRPGAEARYTLANGRGAHFAEAQNLGKQEFIVAVDLEDRERDARIVLAAPLAKADIEAHLTDQLERVDCVEWSSREHAVIARRLVRLDALVVDEKPFQDVPVELTRAAMLEGLSELGMGALPWTRDARDLQARIEFVRRLETLQSARMEADQVGSARWPAVSDEALAASTETWLAPFLDGITRREHLARLALPDILRVLLPWEQQRRLEELAPTHLRVPSGSNVRIDYLDDNAPSVSVRLQEVFGLQSTPRIGSGRIPVTFKLLSPAQRPVQITSDLASFWKGAYADVRKDLRGRYPRHYWPENPLEAAPTRGVRRRP